MALEMVSSQPHSQETWSQGGPGVLKPQCEAWPGGTGTVFGLNKAPGRSLGQDPCPLSTWSLIVGVAAPWRAVVTPTLVPVALLDTLAEVRRTRVLGVTGVARCC